MKKKNKTVDPKDHKVLDKVALGTKWVAGAAGTFALSKGIKFCNNHKDQIINVATKIIRK